MIQRAHRAELRQRFHQQGFALEQWKRTEIKVLECQKIERVVGRGQFHHGAIHVDRHRETPALLQP